MNTIEKYNRLEELKYFLFKNKRLMVEDVVDLLKVSYPTARRYIQELISRDKNFCKIRNGISIISSLSETEHVFEEKLLICSEQKHAIARKCASLISEGESLLIDSGTSCYFFSKELYHNDLRVITTDLKISMELSGKKGISLYTIGGQIRSGYYSIGGDMARDNLTSFNVQTAVMSADAIDIERGITNSEMFEVSVKKEIRNSAQTLILLADSSKFNKQAFYFIMPISYVDIIITDSGISEENRKQIEKSNIKLIVV